MLGRESGCRWRRFWFAPDSAAESGFCRFVFFALVLTMFVTRDFSALGAVCRSSGSPSGSSASSAWRSRPPASLQVVQTVWRVALVASCVGSLTRVSTAVAFVLGTYLLGLLFCFGGLGSLEVHPRLRDGEPGSFAVRDSLSVDRWIRARRGTARTGPRVASIAGPSGSCGSR